MFPDDLLSRAEALLDMYRERGWMLSTAESCTGGLIAACLTEIAGSSDVVERGFVTYSNHAKSELLDVPAKLIEQHGAVSAEVARAMAEGALAHSRAHAAVSVTGVAGPGGGSADKPVGLVHFGLSVKHGAAEHHRQIFDGDRAAIRLASVAKAFDLLETAVGR
ncbi:MAG: CinA family protein [Rhodovibrionaceae bacterium]|nr:CinA family protein [Rhodovibrionaceae bacterium]